MLQIRLFRYKYKKLIIRADFSYGLTQFKVCNSATFRNWQFSGTIQVKLRSLFPIFCLPNLIFMTKIFAWASVILLLSGSCADDISNDCADPLGTDANAYENDTWMCYLPDINGCFLIDLDQSPVIRAIVIPGRINGTVADAGSFACLRDMPVSVSAEFNLSVVAEEKHGYIVMFPDSTYGRFYIESWRKSSNGKVIQLNIVRQYPL